MRPLRAAPVAVADAVSSIVDATPRSVLIVEDDDQVARFFQRALGEGRYLIHRARNGADAVDLTQTMSFDAIVSDIAMPGIDGMELLRRVREYDADVPVVLVTGNPEVATAITAVEYGALSYLVKPVRPQELQDAVARAIESKTAATLYRRAVKDIAESEERLRLQKLNQSHFCSALDALYMEYQPIVEPRARRIVGYEALMRTREPALAKPVDLIAAAEELNQVHELGRAVRRSVAESLRFLPCDALVFVNVHPGEMLDSELYSTTNPLHPFAERVVFEVVEQARLDIDQAADRIGTLRSQGFRFAIDDLGAGYAALTNLVRFEPDFAKIDMSLVRDVHRFPAKRMLIGSLVQACSELGTRLVCEGVETEIEGHTLLDLGAELLQGFYFAEPRALFDPLDRELVTRKVMGFFESWAESAREDGGPW